MALVRIEPFHLPGQTFEKYPNDVSRTSIALCNENLENFFPLYMILFNTFRL